MMAVGWPYSHRMRLDGIRYPDKMSAVPWFRGLGSQAIHDHTYAISYNATDCKAKSFPWILIKKGTDD